MFAFQSDSELPDGNLIILISTFLIALLLSFAYSPDEHALSRLLASLRDVITAVVCRITDIESLDTTMAHPILEHERPVPVTMSVAEAPNSEPAIPTIQSIISQPIPANRFLSLISAVADVARRLTIHRFSKTEININNTVHRYPDEHEDPVGNTHHIRPGITPDYRYPAVPDELARALKTEVLSALTSSSPRDSDADPHDTARGIHRMRTLMNTIQSALGGLSLRSSPFSAEATQRTVVRYSRRVRSWFGYQFVGGGQTRTDVLQGQEGEEGQGVARRDIEMGQILGDGEEVNGLESTSWTRGMTSEVVREMRAMCELIPPEGAAPGYSAQDAPGAGWKIKLKNRN